MKICAVTTFNQSGFNRYAQKMLASVRQHWPAEVEWFVYAEKCPDAAGAIDLDANVSSVALFKRKYGGPGGGGDGYPHGSETAYNFRFDAIRFCHKVFAQEDAMRRARAAGADLLIWVDADTITHSPIPKEYLEGILPPGAEVGYLGRARGSSETGFIVFRTTPLAERLVRDIADTYRSGLVFKLNEWHDGFVFDHCRREMGISGASLSGAYENNGHPFVNCSLGRYMDHLKGDGRKKSGRSRPTDLVVERRESWWKGGSSA